MSSRGKVDRPADDVQAKRSEPLGLREQVMSQENVAAIRRVYDL